MKGLANVLRSLAQAASRRRKTAVFIGAAFLVLAVEASVVLAGGSPLNPTRASARHDLAANPIAIAAAHARPGSKVIVGHSVANDTSLPLRAMPPLALALSAEHGVRNPFIPNKRTFTPDAALQTRHFPNAMQPDPQLRGDRLPRHKLHRS